MWKRCCARWCAGPSGRPGERRWRQTFWSKPVELNLVLCLDAKLAKEGMDGDGWRFENLKRKETEGIEDGGTAGHQTGCPGEFGKSQRRYKHRGRGEGQDVNHALLTLDRARKDPGSKKIRRGRWKGETGRQEGGW